MQLFIFGGSAGGAYTLSVYSEYRFTARYNIHTRCVASSLRVDECSVLPPAGGRRQREERRQLVESQDEVAAHSLGQWTDPRLATAISSTSNRSNLVHQLPISAKFASHWRSAAVAVLVWAAVWRVLMD